VNDGKLTVTVGESDPVVFSANDSADRAVVIPVATGETAGLVRITSAVDPGDPDAAVTAAAVLDELDGYVPKVGGAAAGNIAVLTSEGSMSDSGISSEDVEIAMARVHTHDNKSVLDEVTAPYTMEEQDKLAGIEAGAQKNSIEKVKAAGIDLDIADKAVNIPAMTGASAQGAGTSGLVPAPLVEEKDKFLKGDGTWGEAGSSVRISYDAQTEELSLDFYSHTNEVLIGGRWYPYVQIGNQLWLVDNLDYQWDGLIVGGSETSTSEQIANYFNDDQSIYGVNGNKYGLLYNWVAVKYLNDNKGTLLPSGWHVPSKDESDTLISFVGGSSTAGLKLKSATGWNSGYKGTNDYGFTAYPAGYRHRLGDYVYLGTETRFWNSTSTSYPEYQFFYLNNSDQSLNSATSMDYQFSLRLVKDIT
jgi:uncharacterized protein (TIGR02145 family)